MTPRLDDLSVVPLVKGWYEKGELRNRQLWGTGAAGTKLAPRHFQDDQTKS